MEEAPSGGKEAEPQPAAIASAGHERHCFVVMPSGREPDEQKWFKGWDEVVIKPAIIEAGYDPILAASEEQPSAINDEIRTHLALDPMVVVDLGCTGPEDDPNPNVMYELGIRHALDLPLVMMAWKGQRLPFDVSNQRAIMESRDLLDLEHNKKKLSSFIHAAKQGRYYHPMHAVGRVATIQAASTSLTEDSVLRALVQEVRDLRSSVAQVTEHREVRRWREKGPTVKRLIGSSKFRKDLYPHFLASGGVQADWAKVLRTPISPDAKDKMNEWSEEQWKSYVSGRAVEFANFAGPPVVKDQPDDVDEELLHSVRELLPPQPWPVGIHLTIANKLNVSNNMVSRCITALIARGVFMRQIDGQLFPDGEDDQDQLRRVGSLPDEPS